MPDSSAKSSSAAPHSERAFHTERELAARWAVSPKMLQKARLTGGGVGFYKIGSNVRYAIAEVLAYEQAHSRSSTSDMAELERADRLVP